MKIAVLTAGNVLMFHIAVPLTMLVLIPILIRSHKISLSLAKAILGK